MSIVFIHGRAQGEFTKKHLISFWTKALSLGLKAAGIEIEMGKLMKSVELPYYATTLDSFCVPREKPQGDDVLRTVSSATFETEFLLEAVGRVRRDPYEHNARPSDEKLRVNPVSVSPEADEAYRNPLNSLAVRTVAGLLDRRVTGAAAKMIDLSLRDVGIYLNDADARHAVDTIVKRALLDAKPPIVVVAHSLGTVVGFNILCSLNEFFPVDLFVTLGSPLGVQAVRSRIPVSGWPTNVRHWTNAADPRDIVALAYTIDRTTLFAESYLRGDSGRFDVLNLLDINNQTDNRHGIAGYLDDPVIARHVIEALRLP